MNPFVECPVYETERFLIRKLEEKDTEELFACYSNPEAAKFFNGDCCGDDFFYTDMEKFKTCVAYWISRYEAQDFVRWTIQDKEKQCLIGTIEVCPSLKYAVDGKVMGILRIDLRSEYEKQDILEELMDVLLKHIYEDFQVASVLMKIQKGAKERQKFIQKYHFVSAKDECNISFSDYYVSYK